ncbi:MAG: universal stress protein [Syntrophales bacterium]
MIPPIKKILYTTDLSKNSVYTFYHAVDMAQKYDARIVIVNVLEPISAKAYGSGKEKLEQEQHKVSLEVIKNRIQAFCKKVEQRNAACALVVSEILVRVGDPVEEILKAAEETGCDLIVLGKHSKGFLAKTLLGSVSRAVLDRARKPVYLVPIPADESTAWDEL